MDYETAELILLRVSMYSDEGTRLGALRAIPRTMLERLAALLVRMN